MVNHFYPICQLKVTQTPNTTDHQKWLNFTKKLYTPLICFLCVLQKDMTLFFYLNFFLTFSPNFYSNVHNSTALRYNPQNLGRFFPIQWKENIIRDLKHYNFSWQKLPALISPNDTFQCALKWMTGKFHLYSHTSFFLRQGVTM